MYTVTVSTKEEFERAVNNKIDKIIITGSLAQKIIAAQKKKSIGKKIGIGGAIVTGAATVAGLALAPATGGTSAVAAISNLVATTAAGTTMAFSTAELIVISGTVLGVAGFAASIINTVAKNYDVKVSAGSTTVECTRK